MLSDLTGEEFRVAVKEVIESERFFPPPAVLRERALAFRVRKSALALPEPKVSREEWKRGYEAFKAGLRERGLDVPGEPK